MSALAKQARAEMRAKATRLAGADPSKRVDSSDWTPPEPLNTYRKTGARPIPGPKVYKHGGAIPIDLGPRRADRKPRATGGKADGGLATQIANAYVNRDGREANADKFGSYHKGGFKRGGAASHEAAEEKTERTPRKSGGRTGKWYGGSMMGGGLGAGMGARPWSGGEGGLGGMGGWGQGGAGGWSRPGIQNVNGATPIAAPAAPSANPGPNGTIVPSPAMAAAPMANPNGVITPTPAAAAAPVAPPNGMPDYRALQLAAGSGFAKGGRTGKAKGGRAKGKTNINIVIGHPGGQNQPPPMMPGPIRPPMPIPVPAAGQGTPVPPMGGPGGPGGAMGAGGPPMGGMMGGGGPGGPLPSPLPMGRKAGGRAMAGNPPRTASSPRDMKAGAGSGLGRLEKASMQKRDRTR